MKNREIFFTGLMLFALFFGAGNLIFPPFLGMEAGTSFWPAIIGFVITGVSLPILAVIAISLTAGGVAAIGSQVHPLFGSIFALIVYLAIGPFFGIPRGASVAYEMGVQPFMEEPNALWLFLFMTVFFAVVYFLSLNPSKLVDRIGQWLTPALLLAITALCVAAFLTFDAPLSAPAEKYQRTPFITGFIEGYLTMDTIAALAFGIVVVSAFSDRGVAMDKSTRLKSTVSAGIIAGIGLAAVYISIAWIGAKMEGSEGLENGGAVLTKASQTLFGNGGQVLLGIIVSLACLTTCIGLISACAKYFSERWPKLSYRMLVMWLTLISFAIANLGLSQIIAISVPVLITIYPFAIVLVILSFIAPFIHRPKGLYIGAVAMTAVFCLHDGLKAFELPVSGLNQAISWVPFFSSGLGWILPAVAGGLAGLLINRAIYNRERRHQQIN
ncbi:branched-chain amino acid transport system II carrier protein [Bacillus xiapuensis]|uniref:branched-chain amino acid transport system II carrier protein n=1 Tax=Bacillus xiapuensis TaxID=2014075 RepID=UPI000C2311C1|nr:branched-chain amino acid transport system II carrier protein [Bacillus xiapuensis]